MLLNDIGRGHATALSKINQHLETNYGFKISESSKEQDIVMIIERVQDEIIDLKMQGDDAKSSPEITKRLLVLEGLKTLREYAMIKIQSPDLDKVVDQYADKLIAEFRLGGTNIDHFNQGLDTVMRDYRSDGYRFPDDEFKSLVHRAALQKLASMVAFDDEQDEYSPMSNPGALGIMEDEGEQEDDSETVEEGEVDETEGGRIRGQEYGDFKYASNPKSQLTKDKPADPWAAQAAARRGAGIVPAPAEKKQANQGRTMRENKNLVKHLRQLLETEVSQAEVMMAAKGFAQELQEMVEKIGRLQNEDLPPVTDQMRETYGMESASTFQTQIYGALQSVMDALYTAKGQVDDAVSNMASTGSVSASVDMDKAVPGMDDGMGGDMDPNADMGAELPDDLDNIGDEPVDDLGGIEDEEPLGRSMKEAALQRKVMEMKKLVNKARKLKESSR